MRLGPGGKNGRLLGRRAVPLGRQLHLLPSSACLLWRRARICSRPLASTCMAGLQATPGDAPFRSLWNVIHTSHTAAVTSAYDSSGPLAVSLLSGPFIPFARFFFSSVSLAFYLFLFFRRVHICFSSDCMNRARFSMHRFVSARLPFRRSTTASPRGHCESRLVCVWISFPQFWLFFFFWFFSLQPIARRDVCARLFLIMLTTRFLFIPPVMHFVFSFQALLFFRG